MENIDTEMMDEIGKKSIFFDYLIITLKTVCFSKITFHGKQKR